MEQKDYLMRQIEQAGMVLRKLFLLMSGRNDDEVADENRTDFYSELMDFLQLNASDITELDEKEILEHIKALPGFNVSNFELLADVFVLFARDETLVREQRNKFAVIAGALYELADRQSRTFDQSRKDKMNHLKFLTNSIR
jgi:hypothetical protein